MPKRARTVDKTVGIVTCAYKWKAGWDGVYSSWPIIYPDNSVAGITPKGGLSHGEVITG
jgi:hypothetical protein